MLFLVGVALTFLASFQAGDAIFCPLVDCVLPVLCQDLPLHNSFLTFGDRICPACSTCSITDVFGGVGKRAVPLPCPELVCLPVHCERAKISTHFTIDGSVCQGCPICHDLSLAGKRAALSSTLHQFLGCPIVECANPGPCPGGYHVHSYTNFQGKNCTGCPYCLSSSMLLEL